VALWFHLLLLASHKPKRIFIGGQTIDLKPGQFATSRKSLSDVSGVSEMKTERLLSRLEIEQQIEQQGFSKFRIITITNWDKYQNIEQKIEQQMHSSCTASEQEPNTIKKERSKECKKERKQTEPPAPVEIPGWLDETVWNQFKENRTFLKSKMTPLAQTKTINELFKLMQDGHDPTEVMNQSIASGWKGVFGLNDRKPNRTIPGMQPGMLSEKGQRTALNAKAVLERRRNERGENN
jgi:hypothetical protein